MIIEPELHASQPPRIASWLLALFTTPDVSESIAGDLLEEFSALAATSNCAVARSWYWRQTLQTIGTAFRASPGLMLIAVIGGFWLTGFATRSSVHAMQVFLDNHLIYESHPDAYLFWLKFPLEIGRVVLCLAIGALVALTAKRMEMIAVTSLAVPQIVLFLVAVVAQIASGREWVHWFLVMLPWNTLSCVAILAGGAAVRRLRYGASSKVIVTSL